MKKGPANSNRGEIKGGKVKEQELAPNKFNMKRNMSRLGGRGGGLSLELFANAKSRSDHYNPSLIKKEREFYKNAKCIRKYKKSLKNQELQNTSFRVERPLEIQTKQNSLFIVAIWLLALTIIMVTPSSSEGSLITGKVLKVGEELVKETMPLRDGTCLYRLQGLKPHMWYEVKISYPSSIPSSLSLQLKRGIHDLSLNQARKLLNTEKLVFKTEGMNSLTDQGGMSILVKVEPEGFVAIPGKMEHKYVIFNIVCDELLLSIPRQAWHVVILVLFCIALAAVAPSLLLSFLLPNGKPCITTKGR